MCGEEPEPRSRAFLLGTVSMPGFRMTGPGAGCPRSLAAPAALSRILSFYSHTQLGTDWFQNKMKLPEAPGALPAFCKHLELPQKKWAVSVKAPAGTIGNPGIIPGQ